MFRFAIDRGGTFTDVYAELPNNSVRVLKLLSVDPQNYADAPTEGIARVIEEYTGEKVDRSAPIPGEQIEFIRMGTTVATNALLERKGARFVLVTTRGFKDVLVIGDQTRSNLFDLSMCKTSVLYEEVLELDHRVLVDKDAFVVEREPDLKTLESQLRQCLEKGIQSVAICLLHSYALPDHENMVAALCRDLGFKHISVSSQLVPMIRLERRASTVCADAYLSPLILEYVSGFRRGFANNLSSTKLSFIMSDGGLCTNFCGYKAVLSGPAGGVVGYSQAHGKAGALIGFDMGGTSTDVSRFDGSLQHFFSATIAGVKIQAPQLDITTVAAGGGSRLFFRSGLLQVGPESAGAHPGPVCYRKVNGQLAVTDANVVLGRIVPELFPKIFGADQKQPIDAEASRTAMAQLCEEVNLYRSSHGLSSMTTEELALGFVHVANEAMCRPIRNISEGRGFSASAHSLACFGGAGGQHACSIARTLGIKTVFVHRYAGILSAYGIGLADACEDVQCPLSISLKAADAKNRMLQCFAQLEQEGMSRLKKEGFHESSIKVTRFLNLRFMGTDTALMIAGSDSTEEFQKKFEEEYVREFGFLLQNRDLIIDDVRVRVTASSNTLSAPKAIVLPSAVPIATSRCYFAHRGFVDTPVFRMADIGLGQRIVGPSLIVDNTNTVLLEPGCDAVMEESSLVIHVGEERGPSVAKDSKLVDSVLLSVFAHRFMSIAEQMGRTLQRTSVSTNIKERKDFSCALFGPTGGLVANAPHLPVHLGSMSDAIRWQIRHLGDSWKEGYVVCTNHPEAGGTHLPDITVITPVFANDGEVRKPVFYVASRGHHADIGGISPGSMPPFSTYLEEEGAAIHSFFLVKDGVFDEKGISAILNAPGEKPMKYSRQVSTGTRDLKNNLSDLAAQVAANQKGILLMQSLIQEYGLNVVLGYMQHVQDNCEHAVRDLLKQIYKERVANHASAVLTAEDYMDDGSKISLAITIDPESGNAIFDFDGTSGPMYGNINAPRSITYSAIIYALRCLVDRDIPLNQGVMAGVRVNIPHPSLLSPTQELAVVGGNVLTSQRLTDVILYAFGAAANSQGDMSNLTFGGGSGNVSYYETICGGSGAGPTWVGQSAVQCHMTNTACTDVEILEKRFPVILRQFAVRANSGGIGKHRGGDGVVRELEFREDNMSVGILSERRALAPRGLHGGGDGLRGKNTLLFADGREVSLGPKNEIRVGKGDRIRIETPGGGAYGK